MKVPRNYQSPYSANSFREYLSESVLSLAVCWKLTPEVGSPIGATSHTQDLILPGHGSLVFKSTQGVVPTAVDSEAGLTSAGLEVDSIFSVDGIQEEDIAAGDWDSAAFEVFIVNYEALEMGEYVMFAGFIGQIQAYGVRFKAEGRPLSAKSDQAVTGAFVPKCVARQLGDAKCKVNLAIPAAGDGFDITVTGSVTQGGEVFQFTDASRTEADNYFAYGIVTFDTGDNAGRSVEVKASSSGLIELSRPFPYPIKVGDSYTMIRGCDRVHTTCINVYDNIVNFRGFPYVPGIEKATRHKPTINET